MSDKRNFDNRNLKKAIDRSGMTREQIAKHIGCDTSSITKYYNGERYPKTDIIIKLAEMFCCSTDFLLGVTDNFTTDNELRFVCDYTGLSEESINNLLVIKRDNETKRFTNKLIQFVVDNYNRVCQYELCLMTLRIAYKDIVEKNNYEQLPLWCEGNGLYFTKTQFELTSEFNKFINSDDISKKVKEISDIYIELNKEIIRKTNERNEAIDMINANNSLSDEEKNQLIIAIIENFEI